MDREWTDNGLCLPGELFSASQAPSTRHLHPRIPPRPAFPVVVGGVVGLGVVLQLFEGVKILDGELGAVARMGKEPIGDDRGVR